jgi:hypothetical protein
MDAKNVLKDQAKLAIDNDDYGTAKALLEALLAVTGSVTVSPSSAPAPSAGRQLVYSGPPPVDPEIPANEKPQATDFDLQRFAQMDEKDIRLHSK